MANCSDQLHRKEALLLRVNNVLAKDMTFTSLLDTIEELVEKIEKGQLHSRVYRKASYLDLDDEL